MKDERSLVITNIIVLLAILEIVAYAVQAFHAYRKEQTLIMLVTAGALAALVIANIVFSIIFCVYVSKDRAFQEWASVYGNTKRTIQAFGALFSFKITRLFYSRFFGLDHFCAAFESHEVFHRPMNGVSVFNIIVTLFVVILIDILGIATLSWGN